MRCKNVLDRIHLCVSRILVIVKKKSSIFWVATQFFAVVSPGFL